MNSVSDPLPQAPLTHQERRLIIWGVLLPVFLGSLDTTVLAGALPTIGRSIGHVQDLPWLITAYLLAATAVTPLYGKVSDIHGRRITLCLAITLYLVGSLVCALAPNFIVLVLGRAVQGAGGGGLTSLAMVVLGDVASPKERGKYYGYLSATYASAGAAGPLLGGLIADNLHWSMIFWLNIPLGLLALGLTASLLRKLPRHERPHQLDLVGAGLIVVASVSFMLVLNIGGSRQPWTSAPVVLLLAFAVLTGAGFVLRLVTAPEPLIPLSILKSSEARLAMAANSFGWGALIGLNIYLPTYLQTVLGFSATHAGLSLMVLMLAMNLGAGVAGQIVARVEHYKTIPLLGLLLAIGAVATLAWRPASVTPFWFEVLLFMIGLGFGPVAPTTTVVVQNSVLIHQFGTAIGTMNFCRSLFSTMLIAVLGVIVLAGGSLNGIPADPLAAEVAQRPGAGLTAEGFSRVFIAAGASFAAAFVCLWLLKEKPLAADIAH